MIKIGDILDVSIEKNAFGMDGIARYGSDKFVIFVKNSVANDKLKVKIISLNKNFAHAQIVEIIEPSSGRKSPFCNIYNACGSCCAQIFDYDFLLNVKGQILKDTFNNIIDESKIKSPIPSPKIEQYRHKVQFPARQTKNSKRILIGYYKKNSHDLTNIKFCPLQPEIINEITQFIRDNYTLGCYSEKTNKGLLKNILFRISSSEKTILLTLVLNCSEEEFGKFFEVEIFKFFKKITSHFPNIKGTFVNFNPRKTNTILSDKTLRVLGEDYIIENLGAKTYKIGAVSFFQVNPEAAVNLFNIVKDNIKENSTILDAYGGVGAIGIWVSEKAKKITLVEENKNAIKMAKDNFELNNIKNYEILEGKAQKYFTDFKNSNRVFDFTILDPPRSGCEKEGLCSIADISKNIIYVSCNPQTLRRDMSLLIEKGFEPKFIQGVDLFPYTEHIECVVLFEKMQ